MKDKSIIWMFIFVILMWLFVLSSFHSCSKPQEEKQEVRPLLTEQELYEELIQAHNFMIADFRVKIAKETDKERKVFLEKLMNDYSKRQINWIQNRFKDR